MFTFFVGNVMVNGNIMYSIPLPFDPQGRCIESQHFYSAGYLVQKSSLLFILGQHFDGPGVYVLWAPVAFDERAHVS